MTNPGQQPGQYWPPSPAEPSTEQQTELPRKKPRWPWLAAGALALALILGAGTVIAVSAGGDQPPAAKPASAWEAEQVRKAQQPQGAAPAATTEIPAAVPDAAEIKLTPKVTRKKCFGSAGCNIDFKIEMEYLGSPLSGSDTWEVTYEVNGVEDGPMVGTLELNGTTFTSSEESVSTTSSKKKITIKVTDVEKVGL